jgi:predicted transposase YdaD
MAHLKTQETRQELKTYEEARQMTYITSVEQIGYDRGRKEGRKETEQQLLERQRSLILKQLARKVGTVPQEVGDRVQQLSLRQLESLGEALFDVETLQDATKWLNKRPRKRKIASSEPSNL